MEKDEFVDIFNSLIEQIQIPDNAKKAHDIVEQVCKDQGWNVIREFPVSNRGDGKRGSIDLVIYAKKLRIGIEIDNRKPRVKSIFKLISNPFDIRMILLRGKALTFQAENIDLIKGLQIK